jgi:7-keto-8-aminopelargonate synthetase-like enzyme
VTRLGLERRTARTAHLRGVELAFFGGCGYLGLGHHPAVLRAFRTGLEAYGLNTGASIETTGGTTAHDELERELARFLGFEAVLLASSGYLANLVVAQGLAVHARSGGGESPWVLLDERAHASTADALRATKIHALRYAHLDPRSAFEQAGEAENREIALCTDAVFPSERAIAPLQELLTALGAGAGTLWLDDCHGIGVLGPRGRGALERCGLNDRRVVLVGTLSKALGCHGGFVAGREDWIEFLRRESTAYAGSSPLLPAAALAATAALRALQDEPERLARLRAHEARVRHCLTELGLQPGPLEFPVFAIGADSELGRTRFDEAMHARGLLVPWIRYADRPAGYYRIALCSEHSAEDVDALCGLLRDELALVAPFALGSGR